MDNQIKNKITDLTDSQFGIYLECIDESNTAEYLIPLSFCFNAEKIDAYRLKEAFDKVSASYSAFSTVIKTVNAQPIMSLYDGEIPEIKVYEVSNSQVEQRKKALFTPFLFDGNLLWRGEILKTPENIYLNLVFSHTVFDGTSIAVLNSALSKAYNGEALSESGTVFDAKIKEENIAGSQKALDAEKYFDEYLGSVDNDSNIIPDKAPGEKNIPSTAWVTPTVSVDEVKKIAKANGVTENIVFLSAFAYALSKFNNQKDVVFSSVESGRFGGGYDNSIGMFVKSFPLKFSVDEKQNTSDFLKYVKKSFFDTLSNNNIEFSRLVKNYPGCADVRYVYQGELFKAFPVNGDVPFINVLDTYEPVSNLDVLIFKIDNEYKIWLGYKSCLYTSDMIMAFADFYVTVLSEIIKKDRLTDFELTCEKSRKNIDLLNSTEDEFDTSLTVNDIFADVVKKYPDNIAVSYCDKKITYAKLDDITNRLGAFIASKGIGKDDFVSVLIPRNEYMAICSMGIIKSGAAYQPLDPTYPKERLDFMISDSKSRLLIADRTLIDSIGAYNGEILYTDEIDALPNYDGELPSVNRDNALILIYTSGTTGTPKGCILENGNITAFFINHKKNVELTPKSKVATVASFGFDAAAMDIFTTLLCGGELCIIPEDIKLDIPKVEKFYVENGITNGFMTTQLGRMFLENTACKTIKHFILGGEKLVPFTPPEWIKCHNDYGPSETIAYICGYTIKDNSVIQPIGKPNGNTKLYVVDSENRLLPPGASGEMCVAGLQVGRGYFERPEKTAEVFVKNPFSNQKGYEKLYKTGDIVRLLPNGNYDFIGRRDGQVKIRGFRVELTEIEQVIRDFDKIKNATVQAFDDAVSGKFIGAFIVSDSKINIEELNEFILSQKPPYMVPAVTMQIDAIPVNANGKVDKRKLPKPKRKFDSVTPPQTDTQQEIFDLVCSVVGTREFGIDTDLYLVGLSSIGSIKLCTLFGEKYEQSIQIKDLRKNNTVKKLESFLLSGSGIIQTSYAAQADYPLTKTQEGILVECISKPESTFYNIPLLLKLGDAVDTEKLRQAIVTVVNAHSYLKMQLFTNDSGNVRQKREDNQPFTVEDIPVIKGKTISEIKENAVSPFELFNSRLFRFKIYEGEEKLFLFEIHHILADGTSINIILNQIEKAYCGEKPESEKYSSYNLSLDEEIKRNSVIFDEAKKYYNSLLEGLDTGFLPGADRLLNAEKSSGTLIVNQTATNVLTVKDYCEKNKIGINGFLCGVFGYVLAKYAGMEYSVFNTVYNGRNSALTSDTVGMLVKTLPVVCDIEKTSTAEIVREVSAQLIDSMSNDIYSFAEISKEYDVKNDIIFVYQGDSFSFNSFCGEDCCEIPLELSESKTPLSLQVAVCDGKFKYIAEYSTDLFTQSLIATVIGAFDKAIDLFTKEVPLDKISLVTDETNEQLDFYNDTEFYYDTSKTIADYFTEKVSLYSEKICVSYKDISLTYGEVYNLASKVAAYLITKGIGNGDVVPILINRDQNMVICAHGVNLAGAAYVGLDPTYPRDRLNFMVEDSGAKIVIVQRGLEELIGEFNGQLLFTDEIEALLCCNDIVLKSIDKITPDSNALIVYSSGTTGKPKGSILTHGNIVCFYNNYINDFNLSESSNIAMYASFGFDGGAKDVFCSPMMGATLYIIPDEIRLDLDALERFFVQNKITKGFMTTQVGTMFVGNTQCKTLTHFQVGGEKFIPTVPPEWVSFSNGYGPSEAMCYVNNYVFTDMGAVQPIGKANRNIKEYIVDKFGNRLPFGACGELCVAGGQTGKGYLNRPEKTAEVFIGNPFCSVKPYDRLYKTGDIVRQLPDGNYVFEGRRDGQVKIRGFRVELTEVEQVIREYSGIKSVAVQAFDGNTGGKFIAAYVVSDKSIDIQKLNEFIACKKPDYMVPAVTMQIDEIPLTSNGKVDKKNLPYPTLVNNKKGAEPANETEELLCDIFEDVLGIDKVYADDDFFFIGGTSITAIKVVVKCNNSGHNIVFKNLFANPTPHMLSEFIQGCHEEEIYAPGENESDEFDYSSLKFNTVEYVDEITGADIGDVLLTGSTGFLGSHILKDLLDNTASNVICLVRQKGDISAQTRFQMMMTYYFEDWYTDEKSKRVKVIDGELSDIKALNEIKKHHFDTIINSAANVKHFAAGNQLIKDNFSGVENLIELAAETNTLLVQISSTSVSGEAVEGRVSDDFLFRENNLNIGQSLENKYIYSKYQAEQAVIDAVSRGKIRAKIIRLGNLMARIDDSEFQINAGSNGFLKQFSGYKSLGVFPVNTMDKKIEFSPIDSVARACVLLSGTPEKFTVFHAKNCNSIHYGHFINAMKKEGIDIRIVCDSEFNQKYEKALEDENGLSEFASFIAYKDNDAGDGKAKIMHQIESDETFTTKALYRLGFTWPLINSDYLEKMIKTLIELGFFE